MVGSGPAGLAIALELDTTPLRVVVVESGGRWRVAGIQALNASADVRSADSCLTVLQPVRGTGGQCPGRIGGLNGLSVADPTIDSQYRVRSRVIGLSYPAGLPLGMPGDAEGQRDVLRAALEAAATMNEPRSYVEFPFEWRIAAYSTIKKGLRVVIRSPCFCNSLRVNDLQNQKWRRRGSETEVANP